MSNPCDIAECRNDAAVSLSVTADGHGHKRRFLCKPHANKEAAALDNYGVEYSAEPMQSPAVSRRARRFS